MNASHNEQRPPQFTLRAMMLLVTASAISFGLLQTWIDGVVALSVALLLFWLGCGILFGSRNPLVIESRLAVLAMLVFHWALFVLVLKWFGASGEWEARIPRW